MKTLSWKLLPPTNKTKYSHRSSSDDGEVIWEHPEELQLQYELDVLAGSVQTHLPMISSRTRQECSTAEERKQYPAKAIIVQQSQVISDIIH